jgi:hypothetical protein
MIHPGRRAVLMPVNEVMSAFLQHQVDLDSGEINQVIVVDRMAYNPKLDAKIFDRSYKAA